MKTRLLAVLVLAAAAWFVPAPSATAVAPARQGWWKVPGPLDGLGLGPLTGLGAPDTADVPEGGLLVAGGASTGQPDAVAALAFPLGGGAVTGPLRLVPDPAAASVPGSALMACPLDRPEFSPADGGPMAEAPPYDCFGGVAATVEGSGAYLFDVALIVRDGTVAVAIVPTTSTGRVVFSAPGDDALPVSAPASTGIDTGSGFEDTSATSEFAVETPTGDALGSGGFSDLGRVVPSPPPAEAPDAEPPAALSGRVLASRPSVPASEDSGATRAYLFIGLAALAGVLWVGVGSGNRLPLREERS